jgi:hypothetical protein
MDCQQKFDKQTYKRQDKRDSKKKQSDKSVYSSKHVRSKTQRSNVKN